MARSHLAHGLTAAGWFGCALSSCGVPAEVCVVAALVEWGATTVPDIDHHNALITHKLGPLGWLLMHIARGVGGGRHRGWTHTVFGSAIMGALTSVATLLLGDPWLSHWSWAWGLAMFVGCLVHIGGDMYTIQGCDLFWLPGQRFRRWRLTAYPIETMSDEEVWLYWRRFRPVSWCSTAAAVLVAAWANVPA